jgi:hypothetical protein
LNGNIKSNTFNLGVAMVIGFCLLHSRALALEGTSETCTEAVSTFLAEPALQACANCHGGQSPVQAPKWMASNASFVALWNSSIESNYSAEYNIIWNKAQNPNTTHGGGKSFKPATLDALGSGLRKLTNANCLALKETSSTSNLIPLTPFYQNLLERFSALVGEDSAAVQEITKYALQLGRADFRVSQNSRVSLSPATASIVERVVFKGCQELAAREGWATLSAKRWANALTALIMKTTGLPAGNANKEALRIQNHFSNFSTNQKVVLACGVVLKSERFLLP